MNSNELAKKWLEYNFEYEAEEEHYSSLAKLLDAHAEAAAIDMRHRCSDAAYKTEPDYINVCWRIMDVPIREEIKR